MPRLTLSPGTTSLSGTSIPEGWRALQLRDFCGFAQGGRLGLTKQDDYVYSGVPAYSAAGQDGYVARPEYRDTRAVVLSAIGANCGRCFFAEGEWTTLANVHAIVPLQEVGDARFLFYRLNRDDYWPRSGSAQPFIKPSDMKACWVALPAVMEQHGIARVLDTLDTTIRQTEAITEKLKQVKQGLLHDLLTRGIDANSELRPPQSQAPHLYKDSPLGWIPRDWKAVPVSDLADNLDGRRLPIKQTDRQPGIYPYYGASGIIDWVVSYLLDGDYVLLGEDGENVVSRHLPLAFRVTGKIWVNNHAHIYEPRPDVDVRFLVEVLEAKDYGPWISGSAQPKLTQDALARIRFQCPPRDEQVMIADRIEAVASRIASANSEVMKLRALKSGLMDDLLTGRVRVTSLLTN